MKERDSSVLTVLHATKKIVKDETKHALGVRACGAEDLLSTR